MRQCWGVSVDMRQCWSLSDAILLVASLSTVRNAASSVHSNYHENKELVAILPVASLSTVRNAARLAPYIVTIMRIKNHHPTIIILPDIDTEHISVSCKTGP